MMNVAGGRFDTTMISVPDILKRLGIEAVYRGREWTALCPNPEHDDKNPSWRIRDALGDKRNGMHLCFPCGFGGTVVDLVSKVLNIPWFDAQNWLRSKSEISKPVASSLEFRVQRVQTGFILPSEVDVWPLRKWPSDPRTYIESRDITDAQVERWGIGFCVAGRLEGRVVFVKRADDGTPIGYSARSYTGSKIRYLEPLSSENAMQSATFGEQHWPDVNLRKRVYVLEGAINALAVERAIPGAHVATTSGSQLNMMIAAKLATFSEIIAVTDPDDAGDKLASSLETTFGRHGKLFHRVRLPSGEDAASIGKDKLTEALQ